MNEDVINNEVSEEVSESVENTEVDSTEEVTTDENVSEETTTDENSSEEANSPFTMDQIKQMMKTAETMLKTMEEIWLSDAKEYHITRDHITELHAWNMNHRIPLPDDATDKDRDDYDPVNGIESITEEEVNRIFGEDHPIIGVEHTVTVDRISTVFHDWFAFISAQRQYKNIHDAYMELLEADEEHQMDELKKAIDAEEDEEKKAKMQASYDLYYNRKYIDFLADKLDDAATNRIISTLKDSAKAEYLIKRCKARLKQLNISTNVILELSQFEKRFMEEKYHKCSQCVLVYFMQTLVYSNPHDKKDDARTKAVCMIFALDGVIKGTWKGERADRVMNNVRAFCDQLIDIVPTKAEDNETSAT